MYYKINIKIKGKKKEKQIRWVNNLVGKENKMEE